MPHHPGAQRRFLVTGAAGFIGFHLSKRLLEEGHLVLGLDGMTEYYDARLKRSRLSRLEQYEAFEFVECMVEDRIRVAEVFAGFHADTVVHLAAQAGVRYGLEHPDAYVDSNLLGTFSVLEAMRYAPPQHFLFASTSSVYGANEKSPFSEADRADFPLSLYAATKKAGEVLTHSYSHLFKIPTTCFRFFTVYGPWGRPDMALFKFVERIERDEPIEVYGEGRMARDFTYIDDLIEGIVRLADAVPVQGRPVDSSDGVVDSLSAVAAWRLVNIAGGRRVGLMEFIEAIEGALGKTARKVMLPIQAGDVPSTLADPALLSHLTGFTPSTPVRIGVEAFVDWYREYSKNGG